LKQQYNESLSKFAFNLNVRRYNEEDLDEDYEWETYYEDDDTAAQGDAHGHEGHGRAAQVGSIITHVGTRLLFQSLKLEYHKLLSPSAFNFNLHRYTTGTRGTGTAAKRRGTKLSRTGRGTATW
jgi:hypothetical protein